MNWNKGPALGGELPSPRDFKWLEYLVCICENDGKRFLMKASPSGGDWAWGLCMGDDEQTRLRVLYWIHSNDLIATAPPAFQTYQPSWGD